MLIEKVELGESLVRITVRTAAGVAVRCPGCGQSSGWEHSRYVRQVADEAIGGRPVRISVSVRRLYCENAVCPRKTFVEQIDGLTERYQRRTPALRRIVEAVAVALAGSAGARLLATLHHTLSSVSVLSRLMRIPLPNRPIPKVVGIDEFALLRGRYVGWQVICRHLNVWDCGIPAGRRARACWAEHRKRAQALQERPSQVVWPRQ
ncbi:transposase family protein [Streptomyces sp. DT193]|uniref:transposase family protein n=1 Tax=Streptomyces sp. DT193 TaxID=3393418 RepID=UPI003CF14F67